MLQAHHYLLLAIVFVGAYLLGAKYPTIAKSTGIVA